MKRIVVFICLFAMGTSLTAQFYGKAQFERKSKKSQVTRIASSQYDAVWALGPTLRKSIHDYIADMGSKKAKKGAYVSFTNSREKGSSFTINAGLLYSFSRAVYEVDSEEKNPLYVKTSLSPYIQYDRNTLIDEEQNNLTTGISFVQNWLDYQDIYINRNDSRPFNVPLSLILAYRNDYENELESFQSSLIFSPQVSELNENDKLVKTSYFKPLFNGTLVILTDTKIGVEYDYIYNNPEAGFNGNFFRTYKKVLLGLALMENNQQYLSTSVDLQQRFAIIKPDELESSYSLFTFSISCKPRNLSFDNRNISPAISIIHQTGEDPSKGFANQSYWALSLEIAI